MKTMAVSVPQIQAIDRMAIEEIGIPSLVLMENAGRLTAREIFKDLRRKKFSVVSIICGPGNNAGDGLVAARHLRDAGVRTKIFLIGPAARLKDDAAVHYRILKNLKHPIVEIRRLSGKHLKEVSLSDVIVDAIFGVGLNREILDPYRSVIAVLNQLNKYVVSVDIPSGLDGTTGRIYGVCVKACKTVTFSFSKLGFGKREGPDHAGKVIVVDIGIPQVLKDKMIRQENGKRGQADFQ